MPFDLRGAGVLSTAITGNICTHNENDLNDKGVDLDTKEADIDYNNALAEWVETFYMIKKCEEYEVNNYDAEITDHQTEKDLAVTAWSTIL